MGLFSGTSNAESGSRRPDPKNGVQIVLFQEARYKTARDKVRKFVQIKLQTVVPITDANDLAPSETGYSGNRSGDEIGYAIFMTPQFPEYFARDLQGLGLAIMNATKNDLCFDGDPAEGQMTAEEFDDSMIPGILACDPNTGAPTGTNGMCDNLAFLEIRTYQKPGKKIDAATGKLELNTVVTFLRRVPVEEVIAQLTDAQVKRFIGDSEKVEEFIAFDSAFFE